MFNVFKHPQVRTGVTSLLDDRLHTILSLPNTMRVSWKS